MASQYTDPYDVVVVGAGMAGIIVAAKLAEKGVNPATRGRLRIALIERGPYLKGEPKPGYGHLVRRRMFTNITTEFRQGGRYSMGVYPEGPGGPNTFAIAASSLVGGGSLHYTAETRTPHPIDYRAWEHETGVDWSENNFKSASQEITRTFNIHERPGTLLARFDREFGEAAKRLGFQVSPTTVAKRNCLLSGFCSSLDMCKYDARGGSFVAYLPIAEKNGVQVVPDAEVQKITIEKGRATGITFVQKGSEYLLKAGRVVVCCGILGTPVLLMRSGYGPWDELGRNALVENPNVGRNIDGRAGPFTVYGTFDEPMSDGEYHDGGFHLFRDTTADGIYDRIHFRSIHPGREFGPPQGIAIHPLAPEFGREHKVFMRQICNPSVPSPHRDRLLKRGRVWVVAVRPSQVLGRTNIRAELFYEVGHPSLKRLFLQGSRIAEEVLRAMNAKEVVHDTRPIPVAFDAWAGSCRAGIHPRNSVVNAHGESHDVENLILCDASIMPRCASQGYGGPTATVAAFIGERIVRRHFAA